MSIEPSSSGITRRGFVRVAGGAAGALAAGGLAFLASCEPDAPTAGVPELEPNLAKGGPGPTVRYPLEIPPTVSPAGLTLTAQPSVVDLGGTSSAAWT